MKHTAERQITAEYSDAEKVGRLIDTPVFARIYLWFAVGILAVTTLEWSILGARLQSSNADQLIPALLFQNPHDIGAVELPAAHTFLLKWPLFYAAHVFGSITAGLAVLTVVISLLSVGCLAYIIYRIERRPLVLGTLLLLLASVLLFVPAVPAPGNLLPVNMAMLSTRNIEYIVYILALWLLVKSPGIRGVRFYGGVVLLVLLMVSDRLFMVMSLVGIGLTLQFAVLRRSRGLAVGSIKWFFGGVAAAIIAVILPVLLSALGLIHFEKTGSASPYSVSLSAHDVTLGIIYAVISLLTNFGANPAAATTTLRQMPSQSVHNLLGFGGPAIIINLLFLAFALYGAYKLTQSVVRQPKELLRTSDTVTLMLLASTITAILAFIATNHYYAGDARYVSIALFALVLAAATYVRHKEWSGRVLMSVGLVTILSIIIGIPAVLNSYHQDQDALADMKVRDRKVAAAMSRHHAQALVGDYWRVVPVKVQSRGTFTIVPLGSCTGVRTSLTMQKWNDVLNTGHFAFLLSTTKGLTDFPACTLHEVTARYGEPASRTVIAGTEAHPTEAVLFYDR